MDLICRTCLAYDDELEPLTGKILVDTDYKEITLMLFLCTGLEISEDEKLYNTICKECIESIVAAFKYRKKVWSSNTVLEETTKVLYDESTCKIDVDNIKVHTTNQPKHKNIALTTGISELKGVTPCHRNIAKIVRGQPDPSEILNEENYFEIGHDNSNTDESVKESMDPSETMSERSYDGEIEPDIRNIEDLVTKRSDPSPILKEQRYIEIGPDDTTKIAELKSMFTDPKNYQNIDKYIRVADKSTALRPYSCTLCNQTYEIIGPLRKHLIINHNMCVPEAFRCKACSKMFIDVKYFRTHLKTTHQPESMKRKDICDLCGQTFAHSCQLREHMNRHNGVKPFKCNICEFCTVSAAELKLHLRSHTGEKPYICQICGQGYVSSSHRNLHIKQVHSNSGPYECVICEKTFKTFRVYTYHKIIHNRKQFIKCEICNKEFHYRKNWKVHMLHHGEKMFKCTVCVKAFFQKQNWQTHMKKKHGVKI